MNPAAKMGLLVLAAVLVVAGWAGTQVTGPLLHPPRRPLVPELVRQADEVLARVPATRQDFVVKAEGGTVLRGWKVRAPRPSGDWVLMFHGVSDNRLGMTHHAAVLLRNGYSVLLMDSRAHGASGGATATYGWKEREDVRAIADAVFTLETVHCFFLLGESMGGAIALQAAAVEPRVEGVVAEAAFANLREASFDYAGLRLSHWLGRTLFRPASSVALRGAENEGGFRAEDISPERAVAARAFPVLLISGAEDRNIPPRHARRIHGSAKGRKEMWLVRGAEHSNALGVAPQEFERRVVEFYVSLHRAKEARSRQGVVEAPPAEGRSK